MFYVYVYSDPITLIPFYVGKGTGDRDKNHLWNMKTHPNENLKQTLLQIVANNQRPIIERLFETDNEQLAYTEEKRFILKYGRLDLGTGSLCNKTPGGEGFGNTGTHWSESKRRKVRQRYLDHTPGVGFSKYDLRGTLLAVYDNARQLRDSGITNTQVMAIRKCCRGERYSVVGFRWSYKNKELPIASTTMKQVIQYTKDDVLVNCYVSIAEASALTGINAGDIASVARGNTRMRSAGGYKWRYSN